MACAFGAMHPPSDAPTFRLMSLMQTCKQRLADPFDLFICRQLITPTPLVLPLLIAA